MLRPACHFAGALGASLGSCLLLQLRGKAQRVGRGLEARELQKVRIKVLSSHSNGYRCAHLGEELLRVAANLDCSLGPDVLWGSAAGQWGLSIL